jgi:hypothetical protein
MTFAATSSLIEARNFSGGMDDNVLELHLNYGDCGFD